MSNSSLSSSAKPRLSPRISKNLLVCGTFMVIFQSMLLVAASQLRPEATLPTAQTLISILP